MTPLCWAVYLGCTTPRRLATEWGVDLSRAYRLLGEAARRGEIQRMGRGVYACARRTA